MRSPGRSLRPSLLPAALLALAACSETGASAGASVVRDSAGIAIVESRAAAWRQGEELVLSAEPTLAIGEEGGAPEHEFGDIADARRLSDGRLAVFDRMAGELRLRIRLGLPSPTSRGWAGVHRGHGDTVGTANSPSVEQPVPERFLGRQLDPLLEMAANHELGSFNA